MSDRTSAGSSTRFHKMCTMGQQVCLTSSDLTYNRGRALAGWQEAPAPQRLNEMHPASFSRSHASACWTGQSPPHGQEGLQTAAAGRGVLHGCSLSFLLMSQVRSGGFALTMRPLKKTGTNKSIAKGLAISTTICTVSATALATFLSSSLVVSRTCTRASTRKHTALRPSHFAIPASSTRAAWASPLVLHAWRWRDVLHLWRWHEVLQN